MNHPNAWTDDERKGFYDLMEQIQKTDFALVELNLYLNTHPDDQNAIAEFNQLVQKSMQLKYQFQSGYGPLYNFGNSYSPAPFMWKEAPWPWQI